MNAAARLRKKRRKQRAETFGVRRMQNVCPSVSRTATKSKQLRRAGLAYLITLGSAWRDVIGWYNRWDKPALQVRRRVGWAATSSFASRKTSPSGPDRDR